VTGTADPFEHEDAAYVLGALSHEDRLAYEEHLRTCARCSAAVAELAVLPGLLARLPGLPAPAGAPEPPPDTVLPGLLARMRRSRSRRRTWGAVAAVATAAVLVIGTAVVTGQPRSAAPPASGVPVTMVDVAGVPVTAELRLEDVAWGTRITMTCRYDGPRPSGPYGPHSYQLVVVSVGDRSTQSVAQWQVLPGRDASVAGSTDLSPAEIAEVQLRDGDGTVLLAGRPSR
jgi:hypothetical protein